MSDNFNKAELKPLCRGNRTDRGWVENEELTWTPSVFDRRRLAVTAIGMAAEVQGGQIHPAQIPQIFAIFATDQFDLAALAKNFKAWQAGIEA
jgi:hypothetical protein